jgi:hypothetical protein
LQLAKPKAEAFFFFFFFFGALRNSQLPSNEMQSKGKGKFVCQKQQNLNTAVGL